MLLRSRQRDSQSEIEIENKSDTMVYWDENRVGNEV